MHKHAKIIMEWAQMMQMPESEWRQMRFKGPDDEDWDTCDNMPGFYPGYEYRWKPRTIRIGDIDVPEPVRSEPNYNSTYYYPSILSDLFYSADRWVGDSVNIAKLKNGLVHYDAYSAILHAKALLSLTQKKE